MKILSTFLFIIAFSQISMALNGQIIADHSVVDQYDDIPQEYINSVKKMLVYMAGESHSIAYQVGPELLELMDDTYQVETYSSDPPPAYSDQYLRIGRPWMMGESSFFSESGLNSLKSITGGQYNTGNPYNVMGFGWCWDMTWQNEPGGTMDPVHKVRWAGSSEGGPDGNQRWGLDSDDEQLTGNSVCMDTYLEAVDALILRCTERGYPTQWIFTTGPVDGNIDNGTEQGFQRELKHDHIRAYVSGDPSRILFDYADILCWNNDGEKNMADWDDGSNIRSHAQIHPDNLMDYDASFNIIEWSDSDGDHIGEVGALRLAKAMWWMLARIAGWDGGGISSDTRELNSSENTDLFIQPGPGHIMISTAGLFLNGQARLYHMNGSLIEEKNINQSISYLDTSLVPSGLYLVVVSKDLHREVEKTIVVH